MAADDTPSLTHETTAVFSRTPAQFSLTLLTGATLGICLWSSTGFYATQGLFYALLSLLIIVERFTAALRPAAETPRTHAPENYVWLVWVVLFAMAWVAWNDERLLYYRIREWKTGRTMQVLGMALLLSYLWRLASPKPVPAWFKLTRFTLFGLFVALAGLDLLATSPRPKIDVWDVQMRGAEALLRGENPFVTVAVPDTGPERPPGGIPYVYPPTQVYLSLIGYVVANDVRLTMLIAVLITGFCLRGIVRRAGRKLPALLEDAPALLFWLTPKLFFILEQSWTDPVQVMLITAAVTAHVYQRPMFAAALFGVALSSKQSMFWMALLAGIVLRFSWRRWLVMIGTAFVLWLPFILWDFKRLKYANLDFLSMLSARDDALTITNWIKRELKFTLSGNWAFGLAALSVGLASWRMRGSTARFALATGTAYVVFFMFNRWAFANYYFLMTGLALLAAAAALHDGLPAPRSASAIPAPVPATKTE